MVLVHLCKSFLGSGKRKHSNCELGVWMFEKEQEVNRAREDWVARESSRDDRRR